MLKKILAIISLGLVIVSCGGNTEKKVIEDPIPPIGFRASDYNMESTRVKSGEDIIKLMKRVGLPADSAKVMLRRIDTVFSSRKMRAGDIVESYYSGDSLSRTLEYMVYSHNKIHKTVFKCCDSLWAWNYYRPTEQVQKYADVTITSSLWADMAREGYGDAATSAIVNELSDIYAWTVNFFHLQEGDRFQTVWTQTESEGELISINSIDFCRYSHGNEQINAIKCERDGSYDKYFNEKGENLRKAFLKAPLEYKRISSKFTMSRKHPVTGKVRPHTGVDYAAPAGTPVRSIGDGVVIFAGWDSKGGGNTLKVQHNSTYTTAYLHLKGFANGIKKGSKVRQGQTIGYVGSTGVSTGPHLDFRVWKNGSPIDPLQMKSPSADPLPKQYKPQLDSLYLHYSSIIDAD